MKEKPTIKKKTYQKTYVALQRAKVREKKVRHHASAILNLTQSAKGGERK